MSFDWYQNRWPWMTLNGVTALFCVISANSCSFRAHCVKVHVRYLISWWVLVLHFAWVVDDAKCIIDHARLCVCLSLAAFPHYCTDPDVTWGMVGVPLVVHYWAVLQLANGFRCYDNIEVCEFTALTIANANVAPNAKCQRVHACTRSI